MYHYWRSNRNVILTAVAMFVVSMTALLFFLTHSQPYSSHELKANVVDSMSLQSHQEKENNYRELLDNEKDPVLVVNVEGTIEFASWDFELVSGHKTDELEGEQFYPMIHPDDLPAFIADFGKTISSQQPQNIVGPFRMRTGQDAYRIFMASFYPLEEDDKVIRIAIVARDITNEVPQEPTEH